MRRICLSRAALLHGLGWLVVPLVASGLLAESAWGQAAANSRTTAAPRSFGGSSSRTVTVNRGGASTTPRSTYTNTVRPSSIVSAPRVTINGTNAGTRVAGASRVGDRSSVAINRGYGAAGSTAAVTRGSGSNGSTSAISQGFGSNGSTGAITGGFGNRGSTSAIAQGFGSSGSTGAITGGFGNRGSTGSITRGFGNSGNTGSFTRGFGNQAPGSSGVAVNRAPGGVNPTMGAVNVAPGWDRGPAVTGPTGADRNEPAIENAEWYRRYRERYNSAYGLDGSSAAYDQLFTNTPQPVYYDPYQSAYWRYMNPMSPVLYMSNYYSTGVAQQFDDLQDWGDGPENDRNDGAAADVRPPANMAEAPAEDRKPERKRAGARISPEKLQDLMREGVELFEAGKYSDAASKFLRVTLADRQNVDATLAYAAARFATGDYQISALAVRRAVRRMPEVVDSAFDIRGRYGDLHDFEVHLARLEQFLADHPDDEDAWMVLGFVRHFSGQRQLAAETFQRLTAMDGADVEAVELFLAAKPAGNAAAQDQPAQGAAPLVPTGDPVLPDANRLEQELISVEVVE